LWNHCIVEEKSSKSSKEDYEIRKSVVSDPRTREDLLNFFSFYTLVIYHVFISRHNKFTSKECSIRFKRISEILQSPWFKSVGSGCNCSKGVFAKMKGGLGLRRKIIDGDRYKSSLLFVASRRRKLLKNNSYRRT